MIFQFFAIPWIRPEIELLSVLMTGRLQTENEGTLLELSDEGDEAEANPTDRNIAAIESHKRALKEFV